MVVVVAFSLATSLCLSVCLSWWLSLFACPSLCVCLSSLSSSFSLTSSSHQHSTLTVFTTISYSTTRYLYGRYTHTHEHPHMNSHSHSSTPTSTPHTQTRLPFTHTHELYTRVALSSTPPHTPASPPLSPSSPISHIEKAGSISALSVRLGVAYRWRWSEPLPFRRTSRKAFSFRSTLQLNLPRVRSPKLTSFLNRSHVLCFFHLYVLLSVQLNLPRVRLLIFLLFFPSIVRIISVFRFN